MQMLESWYASLYGISIIWVRKYSLFIIYNNKSTRQVATKKPGLGDYYIKDVYSEIAKYPKRSVPYYDDKKRYESIYTTDYIKKLKEENYNKPKDQRLKQEIAKYEYSEKPTALEIIKDKTLRKNESFIRDRL